LVALVIATQYYQTRQMTARNPAAAAANPQAQMMTRVMPIFFGFISYGIPAGVNIYFLVSSLFRIAQQEAMYRFDPHVSKHAVKKEKKGDGPKPDSSKPDGSKADGPKMIETKAKEVPKGPNAPGKSNGSNGKPGGNGGQQRPAGKQQDRRKKRGR
jgi:YidC/Oxa1 family membrane protein insertase